MAGNSQSTSGIAFVRQAGWSHIGYFRPGCCCSCCLCVAKKHVVTSTITSESRGRRTCACARVRSQYQYMRVDYRPSNKKLALTGHITEVCASLTSRSRSYNKRLYTTWRASSKTKKRFPGRNPINSCTSTFMVDCEHVRLPAASAKSNRSI